MSPAASTPQSGTKLGAVSAKIDAAIHTPGFLPSGVSLTPQGDSQFFEETMSSMGLALLTSFALVYMLMVILYGSFLTPFVIMFSVPVAIVGALAGLAITGQTLNLFSMIGIIMLFGLVAKNGILLVDYANTHAQARLARRRGDARGRRYPLASDLDDDERDGVRHAAARARAAEGAEFRRSMGVVLIGGLLSSLILTLFLVPVVYLHDLGAFWSAAATARAVAAESNLPGLRAARRP